MLYCLGAEVALGGKAPLDGAARIARLRRLTSVVVPAGAPLATGLFAREARQATVVELLQNEPVSQHDVALCR